MGRVQGIAAILGLAAASYGCSPQVNFPDNIGFVDENHEKKTDKNGAVKVIDDKLREDLFEQTVRIDFVVKLSERLNSSNGVDVEIEGEGKGVGSGFSLCDDYVLTAAHVIPGDTVQEMEVIGKKIIIDLKYEAKIEKRDDYFDLALLKVSCKDNRCLKPYSNGLANKVEIGDVVVGAGFPMGGEETLFHGFVAGYEAKLGEIRYTNIDASSSSGDSGAPVLKITRNSVKNLSLIGLVHVKYSGVNRLMEKSGLAGITLLERLEEFLKDSPAIKCWEDPAFRYRK